MLLGMQCGLAADLSAKDKKYFKEKAEGLMTEVKLGDMAQQQGVHPDVKTFGKRMVDDHGKDLDALKQLAKDKNATLPDTPSKDQSKEIDKLARLSGKAFDKEYIKYEIKDHKKDVKDDTEQIKQTKDADLKKFATDSHKTVSEHLDIANGISPKLKQEK